MVKKWGNREVKSEAIKVGDIILLKEDQEVPCDAIVLSTSHSQVKPGDLCLSDIRLTISNTAGSVLCYDGQPRRRDQSQDQVLSLSHQAGEGREAAGQHVRVYRVRESQP